MLLGVVGFIQRKGGRAVSLERDTRIFREPGFYVATLFAFCLIGGVLLFCGIYAP